MEYQDVIAIFDGFAQNVDAAGKFVPLKKSQVQDIEEWLQLQFQRQQIFAAKTDLAVERMRINKKDIEDIRVYKSERRQKAIDKFARFRFIKSLYDEYIVMRKAYAEIKKQVKSESDMLMVDFDNFFSKLNLE